MTTSIQQSALDCVRRDWAVFAVFPIIDGQCGCGDPVCHSKGKHPERSLALNGLYSATKNPDHVARLFSQGRPINYGIRTGVTSGFAVIDIDDKEHQGRDGPATWARLLASHAGGVEPVTVEAISGGGGRHLLFSIPPTLLLASGTDMLGPGIDVKAEGGYIVADGSLHASGREYAWNADRHPDDMPMAPLPDWLVKLCKTRAPKTEASTGPRIMSEMAPLEREELQSALDALNADNRDDWLHIGMALHATCTGEAYTLWDRWSRTSHKYNEADALRVWNSFHDRTDGITIATLYAKAHQAGWQRPSLHQLAERAGVQLADLSGLMIETTGTAIDFPSPAKVPDLLYERLPGVLEDIVEWSLSTAPMPNRPYSVAAALMLGSVFCSRRYATTGNSFSTAYFLVVGKSGTGKEHVKTTVESVLRECEVPDMIGGTSFTSSAAVWSALLAAPQSVSIIDEMGKFLKSAGSGGDRSAMRDDVLTTLMELYGRVHGFAQTPQYAQLHLKQKDVEATKRKIIERPAMTFGGLTTPSTLYEALKSAQILNGYLNRHFIIHENPKRGLFTSPSFAPVPGSVKAWVMTIMAEQFQLDQRNRLVGLPDPKRLLVPPRVFARYQEFEVWCNELGEDLDRVNLGDLTVRSAELARRFGLIAALATDPFATELSEFDADWSTHIVQQQLLKLVPTVRENLADSELHANRNRFIAAIKKAGERGLTKPEVFTSPVFAGISRRDRDDMIAWALECRHCEWVRIPQKGHPRVALRIFGIPQQLGAA